MLMGAADLVPWVSGGTIALITGVYKELLDSINKFSWQEIKLIKNEGFTDVWRKLNGAFLLSLFFISLISCQENLFILSKSSL